MRFLANHIFSAYKLFPSYKLNTWLSGNDTRVVKRFNSLKEIMHIKPVRGLDSLFDLSAGSPHSSVWMQILQVKRLSYRGVMGIDG